MVSSIYHLHPGSNWMNDPNGPVFIGGALHMFYQTNPSAPVWGNMTWGHAISPDMVHWRRRPHALHPDMPYDAQGVFSGCCLIKGGLPHILYTGVYPECVCLAVGDERGERFRKYEGNPVLSQPEPGLSGWRDPFVWTAGDEYRMALGAAKPGAGTWIEQYRSRDLIHWERMGDLARSDAESVDKMWECPNVLFGDGDEAAIVVSAVPAFTTRALTGWYRDGRFEQLGVASYDLGDCFYAPNTVAHPDGRAIQFGWMRECGDPEARAAQGWQGVMTLPREVSVRGGVVAVAPAREVAALRSRALLRERGASLAPGEPLAVRAGQFFELDLCCDAGALLDLEVLKGVDGRRVRIEIDGAAGTIALDKGALSGEGDPEIRARFRSADRLRLRLFMDGTALELFLNEREALTTRAYPLDDCVELRLRAPRGLRVDWLDVHEMGCAYLD